MKPYKTYNYTIGHQKNYVPFTPPEFSPLEALGLIIFIVITIMIIGWWKSSKTESSWRESWQNRKDERDKKKSIEDAEGANPFGYVHEGTILPKQTNPNRREIYTSTKNKNKELPGKMEVEIINKDSQKVMSHSTMNTETIEAIIECLGLKFRTGDIVVIKTSEVKNV